MKKVILLSLGCLFICMQSIFAGQLGQNEYGFFYIQDDGNLAKSKWIKIDLNLDGIEEDCYFNEAGLLDLNAKVDSNIENKQENKQENIQRTEKRTQNTENVDPTMIPAKAQKAIKRIRDWCNEDETIVIPYSRKAIKEFLKTAGYKKDIINLAIDNCDVNWSEHAVIFANGYKKMDYSNEKIKDLMRLEGFSSDEIQYGLEGFQKDNAKIYINPFDFEGMTTEQKYQKLLSLGLTESKAIEALKFLDFVEQGE